MISRLFPFGKQALFLRRNFSTATFQQTNYYDLLGVESGATQQQITQAYNKTVVNVSPSVDPQSFKQVSEAFVILSNSKSREAYDSLLKSRKITYLNDAEQVRITEKSYLSHRREDTNRIIRKKMNIDEFGRFKGGLPKRQPQNLSQTRGDSASAPGTFATRQDIQNYADRFPEYNIVDSEIAESFKDYHQKDRRDRTMKQPWFNLKVDYQYFTFKTFRQKYLPWIRIIAVLGFAFPTFFVLIDRQIKKYEQNEIRTKGQSTPVKH